MKVSFELDLDHTSMMVWADVLQAFGETAKKYPELMRQVTDVFDEAMNDALGDINLDDVEVPKDGD